MTVYETIHFFPGLQFLQGVIQTLSIIPYAIKRFYILQVNTFHNNIKQVSQQTANIKQ